MLQKETPVMVAFLLARSSPLRLALAPAPSAEPVHVGHVGLGGLSLGHVGALGRITLLLLGHVGHD